MFHQTGREPATLSPVTEIPAFAVIIRAIWERGPAQAAALAELERRRLWLSKDQVIAAGLTRSQQEAVWDAEYDAAKEEPDAEPEAEGGRASAEEQADHDLEQLRDDRDGR